MKIALCFFGLPRYSEYIISTLKQHLLNLYDVDIYAHFWWSNDMIGQCKHRAATDIWEADTIDRLTNLIPFKKIVLEPQIHFDISNLKPISNEPDMKHLSVDICKDTLFGLKSKWYSTHQSFNLIDRPEEYDFIILSRLDCDYSKPIDLSMLNSNTLYIQDGFRSGWDRGYNDIFTVGHVDTIKYYADIYKYIEKYHIDGIPHMHTYFEKLLKTDVPVQHQLYSFGVWMLHESMFKNYRKNSLHLTNPAKFIH